MTAPAPHNLPPDVAVALELHRRARKVQEPLLIVTPGHVHQVNRPPLSDGEQQVLDLALELLTAWLQERTARRLTAFQRAYPVRDGGLDDSD